MVVEVCMGYVPVYKGYHPGYNMLQPLMSSTAPPSPANNEVSILFHLTISDLYQSLFGICLMTILGKIAAAVLLNIGYPTNPHNNHNPS